MKGFIRELRIVIISLVLVILINPLAADITITGTVTDSIGMAIDSAKVRVIYNKDTTRVFTSADGNYQVQFSITEIQDYTSTNLRDFELISQNYPNPFNPSTKIAYTIPETQFVTINIYNLLGEKIAVPVNEIKSQGRHILNFNGSKLASGIYLYQIETENFVKNQKMMLIK